MVMAGVTHSNVRRGLATLVVGGAIAIGAAIVATPLHASAAGVPTKSCAGPSGGPAKPGESDVCTVSILGILANNDQYIIQPATPAGATITSCTGASVTTPFAYTTTTDVTNNACTWKVSGVTGASAGNLVLGTETLHIPSATASGTSVTQTMTQCAIVPPVVGTLTCGPSTPVGTSGTGSCVGGSDLPILGGCAPALPAITPTPTATPTASSSGGGGSSTTGNGTTAGGVQAASTSKSTPFTAGPPHPLPVAATLVAVGGGVLALFGLVAPRLLRRRQGQ